MPQLDDIIPAIRHPNNHLRGSLVRGAFAFQKPSPGTCFACGKSGPWRASCPLYQHSSSAAGKQWLAQDGFEGVVFSCIYCLSRCASSTFTYTLISICYTSDTESLDEAISYLNVCDQKKNLFTFRLQKVSRNNRSALTEKLKGPPAI